MTPLLIKKDHYETCAIKGGDTHKVEPLRMRWRWNAQWRWTKVDPNVLFLLSSLFLFFLFSGFSAFYLFSRSYYVDANWIEVSRRVVHFNSFDVNFIYTVRVKTDNIKKRCTYVTKSQHITNAGDKKAQQGSFIYTANFTMQGNTRTRYLDWDKQGWSGMRNTNRNKDHKDPLYK